MATAKGRVVRYSGRVINIESATEHVNVTSLGCLRGHFVLILSSMLAVGFCEMQKLRYLSKG